MEIKIQKTIPLINLSNNKSEIKTLKILEIKNGNKSKIIELFDNSNIKKSDLETLTGEEKFALDNYLSKAIKPENVVIDESPVLPFKPYSIKKRADENKWNLDKIKSQSAIDKVKREKGFNYTIKDVYDEMNKEKGLVLPDENEAIKEALRIRRINKFSIPFDKSFLSEIKDEDPEGQIYLIGKSAFVSFLKQNNLEYTFNEDSICVLKDSGAKIKISTKIWNTIEETPYSTLPYLNLFANDKIKDYDYKVQLLAISKNKTISKIEKIVVLGYLEKENIIQIYNDFKPSKKCKYPCLKSEQLKPIEEFLKIDFKSKKELNKINKYNKNKNSLNGIDNPIETKKPEILSITIGKDYIEKAKEFSKALIEKGIISKIDYNNNNLSFEENKYNNSVQGKFAEMAFYDFLKSKNIATQKDWDDMLTVLDTNYDFGDFRLPNNEMIDIKSYTYLDKKYNCFPFSRFHLEKDMDYFVFSVVNGIQKTKYEEKDFNKNEYKVDFYGFINKYKIKSLINEGKIKIIHNTKGDEFCLIPWEILTPIDEIYKP